jgi:hypothetical protein
MAELKIDVTKLVGRCCELVLDETEYAGKTLREWINDITNGDYVPANVSANKAKPVTTVWMRGENKDEQDGIFCCECKYFVPCFYDYYYDVNDLKNDYMYCPHCGRKAEGSNTP